MQEILYRHPDRGTWTLFTSWEPYIQSDIFFASEVLDTNRYWIPLEYIQMMKSLICHTFIGFQRFTRVHINTDLLRVHQSIRQSRYLFYSQNCLSKVFRSTAKQPTQESSNIQSLHQHQVLPFSTLYTTILHLRNFKNRLATIIRNPFIYTKGICRYIFWGVLGRKGPYFVKEHSDSKSKYTEDDIITC